MQERDVVKEYYGKTLQSSEDLKTTACCDIGAVPEWLKPLLANIHPEVLSRYYGCGLIAPALLEGCRILDLGCGSGRDVYALAQLVGPTGEVVGLDMTDEQLDVARRHQGWHAEKFGYNNVRFVQGYMEQLDELNLEPGSFDVIVSNCVINLSPDKDAVLRGVHRLLKDGGEMYFSDVYADRRVPESVRTDPVLYGECLGGALYWGDFLRIARRAGFTDPRLVEDRPLEVTDPVLAAKTGAIRFFSATYRLFRSDKLETECEDYGQAVIYKGSIPNSLARCVLDKHHDMETGRVFPVCGNTWHMLKDTRFAPHFDFIGDFSRHYGIFAGCGGGLPYDDSASGGGDGAACC
ncbi:MAG: methyltransferase domain-containing protein [Pseudomonadales bacterium]|nr:methyltransferase domain-containing protein [Pseudomonadales bacterium]MCP5329764.1 methyltransferase domain-containing protein [Pseudomonadales bacterium]MCP5343699.1 methyltransferase domain-containing protein [Pseudomonadales bacterium]